jgi:enoyl-CoA hydratase/carnithine racemase
MLALSPAEADARIASYQAGFTWLSDPARVTIAAVQGHAIGAGFQLALACDFRVLAEDAQFCMAETGLGLVPDLGGTLPLVRLVGYSRAAEMCVTSRRISAEESLRIGLANSVVPASGLDAAVEELVAAVLKPMPGAVTETLALIASAASGPAPEAQLALERAAQLRRLQSFAAMSAQS